MEKQNLLVYLLLLGILAYLFSFLQINFSKELGDIYLGMIVASFIIIGYALFRPDTDDGHPIKKYDWASSILWGVVAFAIFAFIAKGTYNYFGTQATTGEILRTFTQAAALEKFDAIRFGVYSFLVPIIENILLLGVSLYLLHLLSKFNIYDSDIINPSAIALIIMVGAIWAIFHLTARGITNSRDLTIAFFFGAIAATLVLKRQQILDSFVMHIGNNAWAQLAK